MKRQLLHILIAALTLVSFSAVDLHAQDVYRVIDEKITMTQEVRPASNTKVSAVVNNFIDGYGGYVKGSYASGNGHLYADLPAPTLHVTAQNCVVTAKVHLDVRSVNGYTTISLSCDRVDLYFNNTELSNHYNPAVVYPIKPSFDQTETMIVKEDVRTVFDRLIAEMKAIKKDLAAAIKAEETMSRR